YGYIYSGINVPMTEQRGTVILVVARESVIGLDYELARLHSDLIGDGWRVIRHDVSRNDTPQSVRALIMNDFYTDPANVNTVFLLGHVPILHSGYMDYDGHGARAMPADAYYGEVFNDWPTAPASSPSYLPSDVNLMVGRVDLANMPGKGAANPWPNETELLRRYLNKDHLWRHGQISVGRWALMGNRRGDEAGLATAASGYRNFEPLVGPGRTVEANINNTAPADRRWISLLTTGRYLWAYGCGAGQDTGVSYLGHHGPYAEVWSTDIVGFDAQAVFVMFFGSYLGNWDRADNIMRAVLATPSVGLASCMAGQPHWFFHHMGLGETIGYSTRLTMNNQGLYKNQSNPYARAVFIALMGDPTLRMEPIAPAANLNATVSSTGVYLSWSPSTAPGAGYHVYRATSSDGPFTRLTGEAVSATAFTDSTASPNTYTYMVRAVTLVSNPSGSYYNPSQGVFTTCTVEPVAPPMMVQVSPSPAGLALTWNSQAGVTYRVQAATDLAQPTWLDISGYLQGTGPSTSWTDSSVSGHRFYRVVSP
ncbi:MAG TPA: fibronectin type III domain-containing protein, partial [Clostridia bacterium]|nr:fibronectin type III domain-containing protein [Clostridia bacterium]